MRLNLQQGKDLLPLHTGKTFEKVCNGVTGLQMVKQTLNRYPGPGKDRLASENFRVPRNDFLHGNIIAPAATLCEPKLLQTSPYPLVALVGDPHEFPEFKQRVLFPGSQVVALLEAVKNKLLDWSIELGQRGIVGENMAFNEKEQNAARSQVFNIQNMHGVIGDPQNSQVNIYDYSSTTSFLRTTASRRENATNWKRFWTN